MTETFIDDQQPISAERWRAWEERTRLRTKANARKITVVGLAVLVVLWMAGMITSYTLAGSIHIVLLAVVGALVTFVGFVALVLQVLWDRRWTPGIPSSPEPLGQDHQLSSDRPW